MQTRMRHVTAYAPRLLQRALGSAPAKKAAPAVTEAPTPPTGKVEKSRWQLLKEQRRQAPPPKYRIPRGLSVAPPVPEGLQTLDSALRYVRSASWAKFDETVDLAVRLNVDPRVSTQVVRTYALLPHGTGKVSKVQVFDSEDKELLEECRKKKGRNLKDVRVAIAGMDEVGAVAKVAGRALGPRGLLPNAKDGTVVREPEKAAEVIAKKWVRLRVDRAGNVHTRIGTVSMDVPALAENVREVMKRLVAARPAAVKKKYVLSASLSSTMGSSVSLDLEKLARDTRAYESETDTIIL